jgi:hypothetical protein
MELRSSHEGRQVKCLTADEGHVWIHYYDNLPSPVRRRLANGPYNICPACMQGEAHRLAAARGRRRPATADYFNTIEAIERKLADG